MSEPTETKGPLSGVRVLDLSRILAGPTCTQLLGDYGAEVIKVEKPGQGDDTRGWGPPYLTGKDGEPLPESAYYLSANRNKRSVAVDIASEAGAAQVRAMAANCDILVENFKVGGLAKYGLDAAAMLKRFPRLVYCSITGFGQTGPNAAKPGYDLLAQGMSGIMSLTGDPDGPPMKVGVGIADVMCGMYAATAILAALHHRDRTGEGQHIDIALADTTMAWLVNAGTNYLTSGRAPQRLGNAHPNIVPYEVFAASDGHVIVAAGNDAQYRRFCALLGRADLAEDPRFATNLARVEARSVLVPLLAAEIAKMPRAELVARMEAAGVPGGPIRTVPEVFASDQAQARGMVVTLPDPRTASGTVELIGNPVKFSATPVTYRHAPPACGQDDALLPGLTGHTD